VRGRLGEDPTKPAHRALPLPACGRTSRRSRRARAAGAAGCIIRAPLGVRHRALAGQSQDAPGTLFPDEHRARWMPRLCGLASALAHDNVTLETGAPSRGCETDMSGKKIEAVVYEQKGGTRRLRPKVVALGAGAVHSASAVCWPPPMRDARGLATAPTRSPAFMNHNSSAALAIDPFKRTMRSTEDDRLNDSISTMDAGGPPSAMSQWWARYRARFLKSQLRLAPEIRAGADGAPRGSISSDGEDLPSADSRVRLTDRASC